MQWHRENNILSDAGELPLIAFLYDGYELRHHWHTYVEFLYIIEGQMLLNIENRELIGKKDDFFVINPQDIHCSQPYGNQHCLYFVIQFEPSIINPDFQSIFEIKYLLPFFESQALHDNHLHLEGNSELKAILDGIIKEYEQKNTAYELVIKGNIYQIFAWLIRKNLVPVHQEKFSGILHLKELLTYIQVNYFSDISLKFAADMTGMSYSYFSKYFKKVMGKSFTGYINYIRLKEAEKLLLTTDKNISEIAYEVGFGSANYFIRLFQKEFDMSPLKFKRDNIVLL